MVSFLIKLIERGFLELVATAATSVVGILLPVAVVCVTLLVKAKRLGLREVAVHWGQSLKDIVIAVAIVYLGLLLWATARVVYDDYQALIFVGNINADLRTSNGTVMR